MNLPFRDAALIKLILITFLLGIAYINSTSGQFAVSEPRSYGFRYTLTGEEWLKVQRVNKPDDPDSFHPSFTVVSSTYRPVVTKHGDQWEVSFRSNLPDPQLP